MEGFDTIATGERWWWHWLWKGAKFSYVPFMKVTKPVSGVDNLLGWFRLQPSTREDIYHTWHIANYDEQDNILPVIDADFYLSAQS